MRTSVVSWIVAALVIGVLGLAEGVATGQEQPKPGKEQMRLKEQEGTWDAVIKMEGMPESKGTMTSKMGMGGFWLVSNFKASFGSGPFEGLGLDGYDSGKKKYVGAWVDSMGDWMMNSEGTYDEKTKTCTMLADGKDFTGKSTKYKMVSVQKDKDHISWSMYVGGSDKPMMTIEYARRK